MDEDKTIFSPPGARAKENSEDATVYDLPPVSRTENPNIFPRPKKNRQIRSIKKVEKTTFFDSQKQSESPSFFDDVTIIKRRSDETLPSRDSSASNFHEGERLATERLATEARAGQYDNPERNQEKKEQTGFFTRKSPPKTEAVKRNLLLDAASHLLVMAGQIRLSSNPQQIDILRRDIIEKINLYIATVEPHYPEKQVANAGICLCSLIDQSILKTPWGRESGWDRESILAELYHTAQTKELMGIIRDELTSYNPTIDILELYYTCLRMDFRYISDDDQLVQELTHALYQKIRHNSLDEQAPLSYHLLKASSKPIKQLWSVLLWVVPVCSIAVLSLTYIIFANVINDSFQPVQRHLDAITDNTPRLAVKHFQAVVEDVTPKNTQLMQILNAEYSLGMIELFDGEPGTRILIRTDELFASGSAYVEPDYYPLIKKIALALNDTDGDILVQGHTDNVPFRTGVNTNQRLSNDRAQVFGELLSETLSIPARLSWQGYADRKPFVCNTSKILRARNRRVEIILPATEIDGLDKWSTPVCSQ